MHSFRIEQIRWKSGFQRLQKPDSHFVHRILVLNYELTPITAKMARINSEYSLSINRRPIGDRVTYKQQNLAEPANFHKLQH